MSNVPTSIPTDLPGCGLTATVRIEIYSPTGLDGSWHVCAEHRDEALDALERGGFSPYQTQHGPAEGKRCGDGWDFLQGGPVHAPEPAPNGAKIEAAEDTALGRFLRDMRQWEGGRGQKALDLIVSAMAGRTFSSLTRDELATFEQAAYDLQKGLFGERYFRERAPRRTRTHRKEMRTRYYRRRWHRSAWSVGDDRWCSAGINGGMWTVALARWAKRSA